MRSLAVPSSLLLGTFTPQRGAVTVQVHNGWVTLTGAVEDAYERREAEAAVRTLDGVAGVTNLIETRMSAAAPILGRRIEKMPDRPAGIETEANWVDSSGRRNMAYVTGSKELVQSLGRCS